MWLIALRDLQFRRRRFLISVAAVALVFAMTLVLSGLAASFDSEIDRTMSQLGANAYAIGTTATGPFLGAAPMPETVVAQVAAVPGVSRADPLAFRNLTVDNPRKQGVNVFGIATGGLGSPALVDGRPANAAGEAVVDQRLEYHVGDHFTMGGREFTVVGLTHDATLLGGGPDVFIPLPDMQAVGFGGAKIVSAVAVTTDGGSAIGTTLNGARIISVDDARGDLVRPLTPARDAISFVSILLWAVAICIIGSVIYLSALERSRDFAVFKATGTSTGSLLGGLVVQAVFLSLGAALVATVVALLLAPLFPVPMSIPGRSMLFLPIAALVAGSLASIAGVRRAVTVDPALAFGGP